MARLLLDTNIVIYACNGSSGVLSNLEKHSIGDVAISALTYSELLIGPPKGADLSRHLERLALIAANLDILPYNRDVAETYGRIMSKLDYNRRRALDRMIAAHALSLGLTLVTNNAADFEDVPGLSVESWSP